MLKNNKNNYANWEPLTMILDSSKGKCCGNIISLQKQFHQWNVHKNLSTTDIKAKLETYVPA